MKKIEYFFLPSLKDTVTKFISFFVILASVILLFNSPSAQVVGPGDWSSLRLYGHAYNVNGFSDNDYDWIENHNHIFTTEKRHARNIYGDPTSEYASNIASQQINANNPSCLPLFYWNAIIVYDGVYESISEALPNHPEYLNAAGKFDYGNAGFRNWWVDVASNQINNGAEEGIFIDAVPNVHSTQPQNMDNLHDMMDELPGFVLYNGFYTSGSSLLGGLETLEHADGVYVETFFHFSCNTPAKGKTMMDALLQVPADKYIITNNLPEATWNSTDHQFGMAAHLIIANDNSFHRYYTTGGYDESQLTIWHEDFGKYLGAPKAKASVNGYVYTRSFENAEVILDVENKTSSIVWGDLTGPVDVEPCNGEILMRSEVYGEGATPDTLVEMYLGDSVILKPQITLNGINSTGTTGTWSWIGPNSFTQTGRNITLEPVSLLDFGIYTVTYEEGECLFVDEIEISQLDVTAIKYDLTLTSEIVIYPNPIEEVLNIKVPEAEVTTYEIISISGTTLMKGKISNRNISVDVSNFSKGIYFININSDGKVARKSFVKL